MSLKYKCHKYLLLWLVLATALTFMSCDKGISPYPDNTNTTPTGFEGKVTFTGNWPAGVQQTYLICFKEQLTSSNDFFPPNLSFIVGPISFGTSEYSYNSIDNSYSENFTLSPGSYKYVVVVQSQKSGLSLDRNDWTVVGVYYATGDTTNPGTLVVQDGVITSNINITCDFNNPPPQ